ncbi:MAG: nuclear transport factor 2 family protein [Flavobacterium sp.]|jgi:predicted SnoaL-like aldol condensation-catalyzing enzyme|nr:nuclear transport factor 2 family protein [Flavobacterium sp.]
MNLKKIILDFYKSEALINPTVLATYLHDDILFEWNSSTGFIQLNREGLLSLASELSRSYIRSKVKISHLVKEGDLVSVRYDHSVKTIENPREYIFISQFHGNLEDKRFKIISWLSN